MNKEITFIVHEAEEGGYYAESVGVAIFAEGETMDELNPYCSLNVDKGVKTTEFTNNVKLSL